MSAEPVAGYMHRGYEKLTEVRTYPQVTTLINRIDWLGSFANEVPFILAAEKLMEIEAPPARPVHPHHPLRAEPHRQHHPVPRRHGRPARRPDVGLLRLPRPRVRAQPDRGGHRRALPPQLRPHRRPQGRPAQGLDRRDQGGHGASCGPSATRSTTSSSATRSSRSARRRGIGVIPPDIALSVRAVGRQRPGIGHRLGPAPRRVPRPLAYDQARLEGLDPSRRRLLRPLWIRLQEVREATKMVDQLLDGDPHRPDHGQGAPHHQGARGRGVGRTPRTRSARWATTW